MAYNIDEITEILEKQYGMNIIQIQKSEESTDGNVYIINEAYIKYILKIYTNKEHALRMVSLYNYLNINGIGAPHIIKNKSNEELCCIEDNTYFVMQTFVNGTKIKNLMINDGVQRVARYLRNLHNLKGEHLNLPGVPFNIKSNRNAILHFDTTKNNILQENEKVFFIDYDDAKYGPAICDVAIAITNLFISKADGVNVDVINMFLDAYYGDNDKIRKKEVPLISQVASCWIKKVLEDNSFNASTKQGLENKYYWINNVSFTYKAKSYF